MKIFDVIELNNKNKAIVIAINGNEIKVKNIDANIPRTENIKVKDIRKIIYSHQ